MVGGVEKQAEPALRLGLLLHYSANRAPKSTLDRGFVWPGSFVTRWHVGQRCLGASKVMRVVALVSVKHLPSILAWRDGYHSECA